MAVVTAVTLFTPRTTLCSKLYLSDEAYMKNIACSETTGIKLFKCSHAGEPSFSALFYLFVSRTWRGRLAF